MSEDPVREKILKAALDLMQAYGVKKFTQPQVAKAAGIRQSHLTYYFPRKIDLIKGLLQGHGRPAETAATDATGPGHAAAIRKGLSVLTSDPGRMRFFLSLILEAQLEPELRTLVDDHMTRFDARVADYYGRKTDDPDVLMFLSALRGLGMRRLVCEGDGDDDIDIAAIEARFQLTPARDLKGA